MENKKRGKKGKYEEWLTKEKLELITGWCRNGLSDEQIAHNMGIHITTFYGWKNKYKEFDEAMKIGKEVADLMVENALFKRACGFILEDKKEVYSEKDGLKTETVTKTVPGDVNAQMFWLKNRCPDKWREKMELDQNVSSDQDVCILMPVAEFLDEPEEATEGDVDESTVEATT